MKKKQLPEKPRTIGGDVSEHIRQAFSDLELHMERRRPLQNGDSFKRRE